MASALIVPTSLGSATSGSGSSATAIITTTAAVTPGDGIVLFIAHSNTAVTVSSIIDSQGNTYTATANSPGTGSTRRSWIYVCLVTGSQGLHAGDTITVTFSAIGGGRIVSAFRLRGVKASGAADKVPAAASGSSTAPSSGPTGTLSQADELELGLIVTDGLAADTFTIGGGFTSLGNTFNTVTANLGLYPACKIVTVATGDTYSATITSRGWVASLATYRAGTFPDTLKLGSLEVEVETVSQVRQIWGLLVEVDTQAPTGTSYPITVTASQVSAVALAGSASLGRTLSQPQSTVLRRQVQMPRAVAQTQTVSLSALRGIFVTRSITQAQSVVLGRAVSLTRRLVQTQQVGLLGAESRTLAIVQATAVRLTRQVRLTRSATQAQAGSAAFGRGFQRTLTAVQTQAVRLTQSVGLLRSMTGSHRIQTSVSLRRLVGRLLRASQPQSLRLVKQVRFTRALAQPQSASISGLPVKLTVVSTIQTRSLAIGRNVFLTRLIGVAQALVVSRHLALQRTLEQPTLVVCQRAVGLSRTLQEPTAATLLWQNVTPRYPVLVTASVSQQLSLSTAGAGKSSKVFIVDVRDGNFVVGHRDAQFSVGRRGVRFTVEER